MCEKELSHLLELEPHYKCVDATLTQKNFNLEIPDNHKLNTYNELIQSCSTSAGGITTEFVKHYNRFAKQ